MTKSKNREAIAEQRIMNQINHPNILFSYGLAYPETYKRVDLKQLEKFLPRRPNRQVMSSVDKLMKKNKYGERQFPNFEKNRSPILKHYGDFGGVLGQRKSKVKMSVSPNPLKSGLRKKFNFSKTFKDFELDKEKEREEESENSELINSKKVVKSKPLPFSKSKTSNAKKKSNMRSKFKVNLTRNPKLRNKTKWTNQPPKLPVNFPF